MVIIAVYTNIESSHCTAKTNIILYANYISIKKEIEAKEVKWRVQGCEDTSGLEPTLPNS